MSDPDCEYPLNLGGCTKAGIVEIKHEVKDPDGNVLSTEVIGKLCQEHGMELWQKQMARVRPASDE